MRAVPTVTDLVMLMPYIGLGLLVVVGIALWWALRYNEPKDKQ